MTAIIPLTFIAAAPPSAEKGADTGHDAAMFLRLSTFGLYGLFPLFPKVRETPTKALLYVIFMDLAWAVLSPYKGKRQPEDLDDIYDETEDYLAEDDDDDDDDDREEKKLPWRAPVQDRVELPLSALEFQLSRGVLTLLFITNEIFHRGSLAPRGIMPFLPQMLTSVICACGISWCWLLSSIRLLKDAQLWK